MDWRELDIIAFDTETTGLNPHDSDRIIEFAAVRIRVGPDGRPTQITPFERLINPEIPIPQKVVQLTGITDDDVADAPTFDRVAEDIWKLFQGNIIAVAHNYPFDRGFISAELRRVGQSWCDPLAEIDTVDLSMRVFPDASSHRLGDVSKRLGVTLEGAHRATNDAEACGRCFLEMARREQAPSDLMGMLDWADALGQPPLNDYIQRNHLGILTFVGGPHDGEQVEDWPIHVSWMTMARQRVDGAWAWRYPESLRRWCDRFLRVRASGRARQNSKTFGPADWTLDSNALPLPR